MGFYRIHQTEIFVLLLVLATQAVSVLWMLRQPAVRESRAKRSTILGLAGFSAAWLCFAVLLDAYRVAKYFPPRLVHFTRTTGITWALLSLCFFAAFAVAGLVPRIRPEYSKTRRNFLLGIRSALFASPVAAIGYGVFIQRTELTTREVDLRIPGLPPELNGLRLVQLSDIHLSPFLSEKDLARAVDMANEARASVALVTGDLISSAYDPLDTCLRQLARLRSDAGTLGCLGNHEIYAGAEEYATVQGARAGIRFLRKEAQPLQFRGQAVNFVGVDYQRMNSPYLVGVETLMRRDAFNILLSHNPDVFPVAARQGFPLTLSGHTHGGQVGVEILHQNLSIARFYTPYVYGLYNHGPSTIYVNRGIGTIGLPARLGAPPEVALLRLCAI